MLNGILDDEIGLELMDSSPEDYYSSEVPILDKDWFDLRFLMPTSSIDPRIAKNRYYSTASQKFSNTRLGGSLPLNPKPQFSPLADVPVPNRLESNPYRVYEPNDSTLGRVYSDRYDDWQHLLYIKPGKEKFNNLSDFLLGAIDYRDSYIANNGREPAGYTFGKFIGNGLMLAAFPLMTLTIWGLKFASKLVFGNHSFDYYGLEPTPHLYWSGTNQMVTTMATNLGILIPELLPEGTEADKIGVPSTFDKKDMREMRSLMPDLISDSNYIDVFKIAAGPQMLHNQALYREKELYEKGELNEYDMLGYVVENGVFKESKSAGSQTIDKSNYNLSFQKFLDKLTKGDGLFSSSDKSGSDKNEKLATKPDKYTKDSKGLYPTLDSSKEASSYMEKLTSAIDSGIKEGGLYAIFAVEPIGSVTESFSNSFSNINLTDKINSVAGTARNVKFDVAGGNIVGGTINDAIKAVGNTMVGALDSVTFGLSGVMQTLLGAGYINIFKKWENSSIDMPTITYTMKLRRTYNTEFSQIKDEIIPFCAALNLILPSSAGRASKASPYLVELFVKGHQHAKLCMMSSLTVTRATGNLPHDKTKSTIGMDISMNFVDLNPDMTSTINSSIFDVFRVSLEDDTALNRYLSVVASRDLLTSKYMVPKAKLRASRFLMALDQAVSPYAMGLGTGRIFDFLGGAVSDHALQINEGRKW